jgi:hypothetical protein
MIEVTIMILIMLSIRTYVKDFKTVIIYLKS